MLALIDSGISTPYELQKLASLSPGATILALQRLKEAGLVREGKSGPRGRTDHRVASAGKKLLNNGWRTLLDDGPSGDLDADLRVALLTLWAGGERRVATDFLRQSADKISKSIPLSSEDNVSDESAPLANWYGRLRSTAMKALLHGESAAALAMAENLPRDLSLKLKSKTGTRRRKGP